MSFWKQIYAACLWQHCDPEGFLQALEATPRQISRRAWKLRFTSAVVVLTALWALAWSTGQPWRPVVGSALLVPLVLLVCSGIAVMTSYHPRFWILYVTAPPIWALILVSGVLALPPFRWDVGWVLVLGYLIGLMTADAAAIWAIRQTRSRASSACRRRTGGPAADLQELRLWHNIRCARLIALPFLLAGSIGYLGLAFSSALLAGYLHLDAVLIAVLLPSSLVSCDSRGHWRTTYVGRTALTVPRKALRTVFSASMKVREQAKALVALSTQGYLAPSVRRALRDLHPEHQLRLCFYISLHREGSTLLEYLRPSLSGSCQALCRIYAALAAEASKPVDLQGWTHVLASQCTVLNAEADEARMLCEIRDVFLTFSPNLESLDRAVWYLRFCIESLEPSLADAIYSVDTLGEWAGYIGWPGMILLHLEQWVEQCSDFKEQETA